MVHKILGYPQTRVGETDVSKTRRIETSRTIERELEPAQLWRKCKSPFNSLAVVGKTTKKMA